MHAQTYAWAEKTLRKYRYASRSRAEKGLLRRYLGKMTGYSPAQLTRLIAQYRRTGQVAHLYRLRHGFVYRQRRLTVYRTKPTTVRIAERRKPDPQGRPGYLRVDTVHQGDRDGEKGVYHINTIDEVTGVGEPGGRGADQ